MRDERAWGAEPKKQILCRCERTGKSGYLKRGRVERVAQDVGYRLDVNILPCEPSYEAVREYLRMQKAMRAASRSTEFRERAEAIVHELAHKVALSQVRSALPRAISEATSEAVASDRDLRSAAKELARRAIDGWKGGERFEGLEAEIYAEVERVVRGRLTQISWKAAEWAMRADETPAQAWARLEREGAVGRKHDQRGAALPSGEGRSKRFAKLDLDEPHAS